MKLGDRLKTYEVKKTIHPSEWQEVGFEISQYFKQPVYYLIAPHRHRLWMVRNAFNDSKGKSIGYFIKMLHIKYDAYRNPQTTLQGETLHRVQEGVLS